jgi:hypothetical protein
MNIRNFVIRTVIALALGTLAGQVTPIQTAAACGETAEEREFFILERAVTNLLGPARGAAQVSEVQRDPANANRVRIKLRYLSIGVGNGDAQASEGYMWLARTNATSEWTYAGNGAGSSCCYVPPPPLPRTPAEAVKAALRKQTHGFESAIDIGEVVFEGSERAAVVTVTYYAAYAKLSATERPQRASWRVKVDKQANGEWLFNGS